MFKEFNFNEIDSQFEINFIPLEFGIQELPNDKMTMTSKKIVFRTTEYRQCLDIFFSDRRSLNEVLMFSSLYFNIKKHDKPYLIKIEIMPKNTEEKIVFCADMTLDYFTPQSCISDSYLYSFDITLMNKQYCNFEEDIKRISSNKKEAISEEEFVVINNLINEQNSPNWFPQIPKKKNSLSSTLKKGYQKIDITPGSTLFNNAFNSKNNNSNNQNETETMTNFSEELMPNYKLVNGIENPVVELDKLIGMESVKKDVKKLQYKLEYIEERSKRGIVSEKSTMHMVFTGNPGTGKTTIARILTGILYNLKYIKNNQCIEVSGMDLVAGFVGQTAIQTKNLIELARGGILFIDEAYALSAVGNGLGSEAVSVLLKEMEDNRDDLIVIFAGYPNEMEEFLNINPGFKSRVNKYFNFEDYTTAELLQIFASQLKRRHLKIEKEPLERVFLTLKAAKKKSNFSNGRFVRNLVERVEEEHMLNTVGINVFDRLDTITSADVTDDVLENLIKFI